MATDVKLSEGKLQDEHGTQVDISALAGSGGEGGGAGDASELTFEPGGTIGSDNAQEAIEEVASDAADALSSHAIDTTSIHGIADTSVLETTTGSADKVTTHVAATGAHAATKISVDSATLTGTGITVQAVFEELDNAIDDHVADASAAHAASAISVSSATLTGTGTDVQAVFEELDNTIDAHIADTDAAHAASAVSVNSATLVGTGTDVQAVFEELDNGIADHIADTTAAHAASAISVDTTGLGITGQTTVQGAVAALDAASQATGIPATLVDAKGDLIVATADNTVARMAKGNDYEVPYYLAAQTPGMTKGPVRGLPYVINEQTGTSYTLVLGDAGARIDCNNASPFTLTIPANASVAYPVGTELTVFNKGAGQVTVAITSDTLSKPTLASTVLIGQGSWANLEKISSTVWNITGELVTRVRTIVDVNVTSPLAAASALATGDGQAFFRVPADLNGYDLVAVAAHASTVSSSGIPTVQIANVTDSVDMLSTKLTIDANEKDSSTAATPAVIDTAHDDVATADELRIDVDVAGTGCKGLIVELTFS